MLAPRHLAPKELAWLWGCHPKTVRRLIRAGRLPAVRLGPRLTFVTEVDAAAFYASRMSNLSPCVPTPARRGRPWGR